MSKAAAVGVKSNKFTNNFAVRHTLPDDVFTQITQTFDDVAPGFLKDNLLKRTDVAKNTFIKNSDLAGLDLQSSAILETGKSFHRSPIYRTTIPTEVIVVDHLKFGATPEVTNVNNIFLNILFDW